MVSDHDEIRVIINTKRNYRMYMTSWKSNNTKSSDDGSLRKLKRK